MSHQPQAPPGYTHTYRIHQTDNPRLDKPALISTSLALLPALFSRRKGQLKDKFQKHVQALADPLKAHSLILLYQDRLLAQTNPRQEALLLGLLNRQALRQNPVWLFTRQGQGRQAQLTAYAHGTLSQTSASSYSFHAFPRSEPAPLNWLQDFLPTFPLLAPLETSPLAFSSYDLSTLFFHQDQLCLVLESN